MSYLDRIDECNTHNLSHFRPLLVEGSRAGWLKHDFAEQIKRWPKIFGVTDQQVTLALSSGSPLPDMPLTDSAANVQQANPDNYEGKLFAERTAILASINHSLVLDGIINQTHGELYPVKTDFEQPAMLVIDRASAPYYGIKAWGQHLNGYVRKNGELFMWIARRSATKKTFPGKLDNMVAGGLPYEITLSQNIVKECQEEATVPDDILQSVQSVGAISYCVETEKGLKPDVMFCYDLELPESFIPRCQDGEVDEFFLLPLEEVAHIVRDTNEFKSNCDLTIIDFLIRHGFIQPAEKDYLRIVNGLRQPLPG